MAERVALVTGASRGIGAAIARRLSADGWTVATAERSTGVDLSDAAAARTAVDRLDRIDALVCNAGVIERTPALDTTLESGQHTLDVNLPAPFVMAQRAAGRFLEQGGGGAIVLVASQLSFFGGVNVAAYAASKGGVAQLTKTLSNEWATRGIRVNAVAPGWIRTDMTEEYLRPDRIAESLKEPIPLGRPGEPEDVAGPVVFLCSDLARHVTGATLNVNGGSVLS